MSSPGDIETRFDARIEAHLRRGYIEDAGFTARTLARLPSRNRRRSLVLGLAFFAAIVTATLLGLAGVPRVQFGAVMGGLATSLNLPALLEQQNAPAVSMLVFAGLVALAGGIFVARARRL